METFDALVKLIVVGDSSVGKTCLILRYTQDFFRDNFLPTIGVDFKSKVLEEGTKRYKLQLWDTAGQERYNSLRRGFYRGAKGVVVVYDITNEISFRNVSKWIEDINDNTGEARPLVLILGNKVDLQDTSRCVSFESGSTLAENIGACFSEVSAKTGHGIDQAFQVFVKMLSLQIDKEQAQMQELGAIGHSIYVSDTWGTDNEKFKCCRGTKTQSNTALQKSSKIEFADVLI